ncbi:ABC transporter permease [bacterium]|nr:ABC transporter permease [candidate division CSSED10-310 bacterium]
MDNSPPKTQSRPTPVRREAGSRKGLRFRELIQFRELLVFLAWRDIKVRYKQTVLGGLWAIIQPLMTMVVFSIFFGRLAKIPSDGIPYPIFSYAALTPWTLFSNSLTKASTSLVGNANLVRKIYFPRIISPIAAVLTGAVDFALAFIILIGMMFAYGYYPTWRIIWVLPLLLLTMLTSLGAGLWLAALNVTYRDIRYIVPFLTQIWMFATPVAYPGSMLDEPWRSLYGLNPMAGVIEGFRWALLGSETAAGPIFLVSVTAVCVMFFSGMVYFQKVERHFADVI